MKTKVTVIVSVLGLAILAGLSVAATNAVPPAPAAAPAPDGPRDEFRARMAAKLGLSADQQKTIDGLRAQQRAELQALGDNKDLIGDVRRENARAIMEKYREQIRAVLTPDQQKKADEMREQMGPRGPGARRWSQSGPEARQGEEPGRPPRNPLALVALGERIKDRMAEKLRLTDAQRDQLEHLGRAYRAQQRDLAKKHRDEMRAVLTPEQQAKAEKWMHHFRSESGGEADDRPGNP